MTGTVPQTLSQKALPQALDQRRCGPCTACCDGWLRIEVYGHDVAPGKPCPFSTGASCSIYERRPVDPCQQFACGWLVAGSPLPEWMRPDTCGFVLLPAKFLWRGVPVDVAVPSAATSSEATLRWLLDFTVKNRRLILYQVDGEWFAFGPPAFQAEMSERIQRGEPMWA